MKWKLTKGIKGDYYCPYCFDKVDLIPNDGMIIGFCEKCQEIISNPLSLVEVRNNKLKKL